MAHGLTKKQHMVLEFLKKTILERGYPPTIRETCDAIGLSSTSTIHAHLESLERKGYIKRSPSKNRSVEILEEDFYNQRVITVPVLGSISLGINLLADENIEDKRPMPVDLIKEGICFLVNVVEDNSLGIFDGDQILVHLSGEYSEGDLVAVFEEDAIKVKPFIAGMQICSDIEPLQENMVVGKVVSLYRRY